MSAVEPVAPADPAPENPVAAPKRRRRGWIVALVVVGVVLVLAVAAFLIGDAVAQQRARDYVRAQVIEVLRLEPDAQVDVDLGGGSIILQALRGEVDAVDVAVPAVTFGTLRGDLRLHAEGVPLDSAVPVDVIRVEFATGAEDLAALTGGEDPANAPEVAIADGEIAFSLALELFGTELPLGLALTPAAVDGALVLTPSSITIGSETIEAGEEGGSFLGQLASAFLQPQTLCVADQVPRALVLADAAIAGEQLVLTFRGDGAALGGAEFAEPGSCPAA